MVIYFCTSCHASFTINRIDNKTLRKSKYNTTPTICPYCGSRKIGLLKKLIE